MDDSSSEGSTDEEEVLRLFDKEAQAIVQNETLPIKSGDRYMRNYYAYKNWKEKNKNSLSTSEEYNLVVYFKNLQKKLSPLTLWSVWSMLKKTLNTHDDIQIDNFLKLKGMIKRNAKGHRPKKSFILTWEQIKNFIDQAPDTEYSAMKVVLIFGICGCLRCLELTNMKVGDVEDLNGRYLISVNDNKNDYPGQFIIGSLFYDKVQTYISKRPSGTFSDRFFIQYTKGRCIRAPIGRHTIGGMPKKIATYLELPNIERYTGHCFRRSSATLLSNSGANMQMIKQLGRWRSDAIAQGYVENSMHNRQMIFNGITQKQNVINTTDPQPSTSTAAPETFNPQSTIDNAEDVTIDLEKETINAHVQTTNPGDGAIHPEETNVNTEQVINEFDAEISDLHWSDFEDDFTPTNLKQAPIVVPSGFTTANNKPLFVPKKIQNPLLLDNNNNNKNNNNKNKLPFTAKPGIKLSFLNQTSYQPPPLKKKRNTENLNNQNNDKLDLTTKDHDFKFDNCTFNNCIFNLTKCDCDKENIS